jgi:ABC-type nitrate/sulfonate/bicarbonate transport system permease component
VNRETRVKLFRWSLSILVFLTLWEIIARAGIFISIVPASETLPELVRLLGMESTETREELVDATLGTMALAGVGFVIGGVVGIGIGVWTAVSARAAAVLDPVISTSFSVPFIIFIPVMGLYLGLEFAAKIVLVLLLNVFVITLNTSAGIKEVPADAKEMARAFGVSGSGLYRKVVLPWASPHIITGLRLGAGQSVQGAILADLFFRAQDLGLYIVNAQGRFDIPRLTAAVFFVTVLGAGVMGIARVIEWRILRWKRV